MTYTAAVDPWIRTADDLARFAASLRGCQALALDSESDSLYHHVEKVCLVQVATDRGEARLVDTLALRDLTPLADLLADERVVKVFHGADYDVTTMKRDFGVCFRNLFDTMIAARLLGRAELGLQAVVRDELGVTLSKESQKDDWSRRPLTATQEAYALADVQHLLAVEGRLRSQLVDLGRLPWVVEECDAVAALEPARRRKDADSYQRVKGTKRLTPRQLAVFRAAYQWREGLAETTDIPTFKLLGNEALFSLAERSPRTVGEIVETRGLSPRVKERATSLLEAIRVAQGLAADQLPTIERSVKPVVSEATRRRAEALKGWRLAEAARARLDVSVVLPQRLLDPVAERGPRDLTELAQVEGIRRWRVEAFGTGLLAALRS